MKPGTNGSSAVREIQIDQELESGFAAHSIRHKARELVGQLGLTQSDIPDLEQEFRIRVLTALDHFDPNLSHWNQFVTTVVERYAATILQNRRRQKRLEDSRMSSLSELVIDSNQELVALSSTMGAQHRESLTGRYKSNDTDLIELAVDLQSVMARLPDELREVCRLLQHHSVTEAAKILRIPRTTASTMVARLRDVLRRNHFQNYFVGP